MRRERQAGAAWLRRLSRALGGGPALPLSLANPGSVLTVRKVRRGAAAQHLANLGFVEGAQVRVVNQTSAGTIVSIKGSQLGLDRDTARQVMCC